MGLEIPNLISTLGGVVVTLSFLLFFINMAVSARRGAIAGPNPWDAPGLEWATPSPPPSYNFPHIPVATSRTPLWDAGEKLPVVTGLRVDDKETLLTTVFAAQPDVREPVPEPSIWPLIAAAVATIVFICSIFSPWAVLFGAIPLAIALIAWFWPNKIERDPEPVIS
jgi:cytochrome c oxidase subunit 1